jgi:hypothetical protein
MNITPHNHMSILTNDLILYHIGPHLNRLDRNNFRLTNKRHSELILCQALLNANYQHACENNNTPEIIKWRNQGALKPYEEICALALHKQSNRKLLAKKLWAHHPKTSITIDGLAYAITQNNLPFVQWILNTSNPAYWSHAVDSAINLSAKLNCRAITTYLKYYIDQEKYEEKQNESDIDEYLFYSQAS